MDYSKTSKLLKKFKGLHHTLRDSGQEPSSIEKDLLLSYLKELYENVLTIGAISAETVLIKQEAPEIITASSNGNSQFYEAPKQVITQAPAIESPVQKFTTPPVPTPSVVQVPAEQVAVEQIAPPVASPSTEPVVAAPRGAGTPLAELFADKGVNELSDKLNKLPISDINRAMGINEKVLTINELFHGDQELFSKTVLKLNSLVSFGEAKEYLMRGVAGDLNWASESKVKKADKFIQLLRRRYS